MCQKDTYAYYLSYATLVSFVAYLGVDIFQLPCRHIFGGFQQEMRLFVLRIQSFREYKVSAKIPWKYVRMVTEKTQPPHKLQSWPR